MPSRIPSTVQAGEISYELHSLGWKAFQHLCITIVSEIFGQTTQSFSDSNDGGRDGAFHGVWKPNSGETFEGTFTVQCKFKSNPEHQIRVTDLAEELVKAKNLAERGLANNYFLFTNVDLDGVNAARMATEFESLPGINRFVAFGCERISQIIRDSSKLRMLVPRVYGLGDLSQILDERAYIQAQSILSGLGDDLAKFVITDAYLKSVKALLEHGFVLLLGEPASGKSTIAAALALGALDKWECSTIMVRDADDFVDRWNPNEPKQFFWVDDAFGATQFDLSSVSNWNRSFSHVNTAIKNGAKILFTSRDYVYRSARNYLKDSAIPLSKESQVVIDVEAMTADEREQILYNHVKMGTQPMIFKSQIKSFLTDFARHSRFSPEIARRLGNPRFTEELVISQSGLDDFVAHPMELLCEIIRTLDDENRSALALVFMRAGMLASPIEMTEGEELAISRLGGSLGGVTTALDSLHGNFLIQSIQGESCVWRFKHPTIRDAFATFVSGNRELMDIYLAGTPLVQMFREVSCGDVGIEGVKVIISQDRYEAVITRIKQFDMKPQINELALCRFLTYRCDREFLVRFIAHFPEYIQNLNVGSYLYAVPDVDVIMRLYEFDLLPEEKRVEVVNKIRDLAVEIPDSGFLSKKIRKLFTMAELTGILEYVSARLLPNLDEHIDNWRSNYSTDFDPEEYFDDLSSALSSYRTEFESHGKLVAQIDAGLGKVAAVVDELRSELPQRWETDEFDGDGRYDDMQNDTRSVFEDVDT